MKETLAGKLFHLSSADGLNCSLHRQRLCAVTRLCDSRPLTDAGSVNQVEALPVSRYQFGVDGIPCSAAH